MTTRTDVPVLVVGGGPAGLTAALLLARSGVACTVVEKHPTLSPLPRARGVHARAVEILRSCGLEAEMRRHQLPITPGVDWRPDLTRPPVRELDTSGSDLAEVSPCDGIAVAQDVFESVLRSGLTPATDLHLGAELVGLEEQADGVRVALVDSVSGRPRTVHAQYVVAADGARSRTRRLLGIDLVGPEDLGSQYSIAFRADLEPYTGARPRGLYFLTDSGAALFSTHPDGRWTLSVPNAGAPRDPVATVRGATGIPDLNVEIIAATVYTTAARSATTYGTERVFLVGDAAHQAPPLGATGISTAMADAHNLAWKLAAVLDGSAGASLLGTYSAEREPVGRHAVTELGTAWQAMLSGRGAAGPDIRQLDMGYQYTSSAISGESQDSRVGGPDGDYIPGAAAGCRAPHLWLDDCRTLSTLDLFGPELTLLTGPDGGAWGCAVDSVAQAMGGGLTHHTIHLPEWLDCYGIEPTGAVLVRPDGHVAWRRSSLADVDPSAIESALRAAVDRSLGRQPG